MYTFLHLPHFFSPLLAFLFPPFSHFHLFILLPSFFICLCSFFLFFSFYFSPLSSFLFPYFLSFLLFCLFVFIYLFPSFLFCFPPFWLFSFLYYGLLNYSFLHPSHSLCASFLIHILLLLKKHLIYAGTLYIPSLHPSFHVRCKLLHYSTQIKALSLGSGFLHISENGCLLKTPTHCTAIKTSCGFGSTFLQIQQNK